MKPKEKKRQKKLYIYLSDFTTRFVYFRDIKVYINQSKYVKL